MDSKDIAKQSGNT